MRQNCKKKFWWALIVFAGLCTTGFAQTPVQYPQMPNTGNPAADQAAYEQAKHQFYQAHPELLPQAGDPAGGGNTEQQNIAYEQSKMNAPLSQEEQDRLALRAENERRELQREFNENKATWIVTDPARYEAYMQALQLRPVNPLVNYIPYSEYVTYSPEKRAMIDANPSLYVILNNQ